MRLLVLISFVVLAGLLPAQNSKLNWLSFEQLEKQLEKQPKKVLIHFYADWCVYCKKMDRVVFTKDEVKKLLNDNYYVVRFNAESKETVQFGGKTFVNEQLGKKRDPMHQIPEFLAGRENRDIELPATIILNEKFEITKRFYRYISPTEMLDILK